MILIIEDNEVMAEALAEVLTMEGYIVLIANTGVDGLVLFRQHPVDLVLLDMALPDTHGEEIIKAIRQVSDVPIIVSSGRDAARVADRYNLPILRKPYAAAVIITAVKVALGRGLS